MGDDIVVRLHDGANNWRNQWSSESFLMAEASDEIERLRAVEAAHLSASREDADTIADYEARHQTSLEVIRAREQHIEAQRIEIDRLRGELEEAREASMWLRIVLTNMTQGEQMMGVYERWPWLKGDDDGNVGMAGRGREGGGRGVMDFVRDRAAAEGVRTALHLRTRYLIAEKDMPSIQYAIAGELDAEYQRGYKAGYDRAMLEAADKVAGGEDE